MTDDTVVDYDTMTDEQLDAANTNLQNRRVAAHEAFKAEAAAIQGARHRREAVAKFEKALGKLGPDTAKVALAELERRANVAPPAVEGGE